EQPVASDLRKVVAAQKMIVDMERIGDQAADIADLSRFIRGSNLVNNTDIEKMGEEVSYMINEAVRSYLKLDSELAEKVIKYDDIIDDLFTKIKTEIAEIIMEDKDKAGISLDLLLVIKYLERIGDHATNIAEWVLYVMHGSKKTRGNKVSVEDIFN
ncbi:MAG: phosphate signaling complex protein PhoU, partial [Clostridiales Family XIII bacterium]|nr:phosphate signaling complex protein PhoU [Clostridiales Family XIII bacterium]